MRTRRASSLSSPSSSASARKKRPSSTCRVTSFWSHSGYRLLTSGIERNPQARKGMAVDLYRDLASDDFESQLALGTEE